MPKRSTTPGLRRKGNAWYYDDWRLVPRKWVPLGSDREAALIKYAELTGQGQRDTWEWLTQWYFATYSGTLKPNTLRAYRSMCNNLAPVFAHVPYRDITAHHVARYQDEAPKRTIATMRLRFMSAVFEKAARSGMVTVNPVRQIKLGKTPERERILSDAEISAIYAVADERLRCVMDLMLVTGLRPVDALRIRMADITDCLYVKHEKTGFRQEYELTDELRAIIVRCRALQRHVASLWLLSGKHGAPFAPDTLSKAFLKASRRAGIANAQLRDMRSKVATDDPENAQKRLGHLSRITTERYIKTRKVVRVMPAKLKVS